MFCTKLISAQSEQFKKLIISDPAEIQPVAFRTPMFLSTKLISAQFKKLIISDPAEIQPVASEHPCFLAQN